MIHDNKTIGLSKILASTVFSTMTKSQYGFYLTGSQFFGLPGSDSDYDFFVQEDETIREFLAEIGFCPSSPFNELKHHDKEITGKDQTKDKNGVVAETDENASVELLENLTNSVINNVVKAIEEVEVYKHHTLNIHIQIVKDSKVKQEIQQIILEIMKHGRFIRLMSYHNTQEQHACRDFIFNFYDTLHCLIKTL